MRIGYYDIYLCARVVYCTSKFILWRGDNGDVFRTINAS